MSVALLPLGVVAVLQTNAVAKQARLNAELALLAMTEKAATSERLVIRRAIGAADGLAESVVSLMDDPVECSERLRGFIDRVDRFSFAGFLPRDGLMTCSSADVPFDFSDYPDFDEMMAVPESRISVNVDAPLSGTSVIAVSRPVFEPDTGQHLGYLSISIPHSTLDAETEPSSDTALVDLITFNRAGDILTSRNGLADATANLPAGVSLRSLVELNASAITFDDADGRERIYTVSSIDSGLVYALGIWDPYGGIAGSGDGRLLTSLLPGVMWIVSLVVALLATHRLVTRHLQRLAQQMGMFAAARRLPSTEPFKDAPTEIQRIQASFLSMTEALIQDEARQENAIREKSVLVKEIHHRVKNNLQMISSIISLQSRAADTPETRNALRLVQDRVLSMATIHRDLYQTNEKGLVNVGPLLEEVVTKSTEGSAIAGRVNLDLQIEDVWLFPDQAVPLSLLAAEAAMNAIKHMPADCDPCELSLSLSQDGDRDCHFRMSNTDISDRVESAPKGRGSGIGKTLIKAFATQLGGKVRTSTSENRFVIELTFQASEFAPAPGTY
ncbi:sensor histidine kinase [Jannaschia pohangensis]|nr:sensor histidine kinase [Jannaschia pohangensis]